MKKTVAFLLLLLPALFVQFSGYAQKHPIAFTTASDIALVKKNIPTNPLLKQSFDEIKTAVDAVVGKDIDVPVPKDAGGGYTHDKHKDNYNLMFNSGMLFQLTGDVKYAKLVKDLFFKYAVLNPTLKNHPEATSASPGRIFWQALNDANWLVYAGLAFDLIHDYLTPAERAQIAAGAFKPEVDYFTKDITSWFDLIHNHAVWACAGVGIVGIATDNEEYVKMALYGSKKDGKAGLTAHLDGLFSPNGYYNEGPYYTRYAVLPFFLFANAVNHAKPDIKIFERRNKILKQALEGALEQTNLDGGFYSYNDALKEKTFVSNEVVVALNIAWDVYGANDAYLPVAKAQGRVTLSKGGLGVSQALLQNKNIAPYYPYKSVVFTDGADGKMGGVSVLRTGKNKNLTSLIFKYSSHGLSHGHYDKLNINLYDNGNEILQDYGASRFINIEQKWGGRYLPETKSYTQQSIAHNTVTVDETSHFNGIESVSEKYHPVPLYQVVGNMPVQASAALDTNAYKDVQMHRGVYLITLPGATKPLLVDFFRTISNNTHQYDLPFNYIGNVISTNFKYTTHSNNLQTLGNKNGYQHIWKEASANVKMPLAQFTFLNNQTFYTISSYVKDSAQLFFTRTGANDPNFNLRREPSYITRTRAKNMFAINVLELHGNFNPISEITTNSYATVTSVLPVIDTEAYSGAQIRIAGKQLLVFQSNKIFDSKTPHQLVVGGVTYSWVGPFAVYFDNKKL
ncbi:MAG: heparinase II/III family protein [Bacteroidetes bacterium]|nr:heparinase II/III family protein [Bacteroidota bacterium]